MSGARPAARRLRTLQVGMGWQGEQAGGLNRLFAELLRRLPDAGVDARGLVAGSAQVGSASGGLMESFAPAALPMWRRTAAVRRALDRSLALEDADLIVSHFAPYGLGALPAARRRPLVVHFHGPWAAESRKQGRGALSAWFRATLECRVYSRAVACIVLSRAFGDLLRSDYGVPAERIHVVPGGVDAARFASLPDRAEARRAVGWAVDAPTVLSVRRLVKRTGIDRLIAAVPALREAVPEVRVMIAGDGPERAALQAQATALGVQEQVRFLGFVPDAVLPLAYRAADLTVVPSVALEGFGLIVPESLAAGTPALVTPVGGLPETVEGLSDRLVIRDAGAAAITSALAEALTGRRSLPTADACRDFARSRYDWPVIAAQVAAVYRRAHEEWTP